jgi:hypothetical protein
LSAKKAAERDARNTIGILHVNNYLKVRPEEFPTDDKLEMNISNALLRDPIVNRFDISVTVLNKKAYLYGVVDEGYEKIRAESVASSVPGIVDVSNNITVRPFEWTWNSDENIKNNIEDEFFWTHIQGRSATQEEATSSGVLNPRHFLGRLLINDSIMVICSFEILPRSVPFGKYHLIRPLICSLVPRSQEE